jgi:cyclohexadieny/prephenate dehydrogenase
MSDLLFERVAFIGIGHIGSSLARLLRREKIAGTIVACARRKETLDTVLRLKLAEEVTDDPAVAVKNADLVVIATPLSTYVDIGKTIAPHLKPGAIVTDVGSVKELVIRDFVPLMPEGVHVVPGHPVAGTENSGPESGFPEVFRDRWCILTPVPFGNAEALDKITRMWKSGQMQTVTMDAAHHDRVLAITSHVPHLIAYTIVGTATDLEETLKSEVIKFSASGFRDFTRIAASDPVMWRDIFLNNREAVLEVLQRLNEDLTAMQRAIRWGEGDKLQDRFAKTRAIRRSIVEAKQA